jgi:hypothetical protein
MKNKLAIFTALSIALLLISSVAADTAFVQVPHPANAEWTEDQAHSPYTSFTWNTASISVGYTFNLTVCVNITSAQQIFSWQLVLLYPYSFLRCTAAQYSKPDGSKSMLFNGHTTAPVSPVIDGGLYGNGSVLAEEGLLGTDFVLGQASTLEILTFQVVASPPKGGQFTGKFDLTTQTTAGNNFILDSSLNPIAFTASDSPITYTWSPPTTMPFMGIELPNYPAPIYKIGGSNVLGTTFNVNVYLKQIDPLWFLNNLTFALSWNTTVIDVVGGTANLTVALASWSVITNTIAAGTWNFVANSIGVIPALPNKVLIGTLTFTVMTQQTSPPAPGSAYDESLLTFSGVSIFDHTLVITPTAPEQGDVQILAFIVLKLPWLQVDPTTTIVGPAPVIGETFSVAVDVENLTKSWNTVAIQFRLQYDDTVLSLVSVTEGPFMQNPTWNLYGTFFMSIPEIGGDGTYPFTHVEVLDLLFPNTTTGVYDQKTFPNAPLTPTPETPNVQPAVAIFTFQVLQQNCFDGANITTALNILPFWPPTDNNFIDKDANYIADQPGVNGTVIIEALNEVDRQIDLVGGAVNDGYGILTGTWPFPYPAPDYYTGSPQYLAFPTPYGGQGPNHYMDIVFPQSQIYLDAYVTYNYWPVQSKDVGFEIEGPYTKLPNGTLIPAATYEIWAKFTATTDANGVATYTYRMPWPCLDPDSITGVYKITSTVTIADQVVSDTMLFYYQRLVYITSVSTDSYSYLHDQCVKVTVNYATHSIQKYPALFAIVITDNLTVPFGFATYSTTVGGTVFCTWKNSTFSLYICIPKWAYAGNASVHVSVYDKDPTIGGEALAPEFTPDPVINIYPY